MIILYKPGFRSMVFIWRKGIKGGKLAGVVFVGVGGFPEKVSKRRREWRVLRKNDTRRKLSPS